MKRLITLILIGFIGLTVLPQVGFAAVSLSQTNVTVSQGQTMILNAYGNNGTIYVTNNQNSSVATVSVSGNQLTVYGNTPGTTWVSVCDQYSSYNCTVLTITVSGYYNNQTITLGQSNVSLTTNQTMLISVSGGSGSYYVSNNTNSGVVQATMNGSSLLVTANSLSGSSVVTVCSSSGTSGCATLYVTVNTNTYNNGSVTFGQTNPTVAVGQTLSVSLYSGSNYSGSNSYYVSSNNNSVVQASVSGSTLSLYGMTPGTTVINVCSYNNSGCGSLTVAVVANGYNNGYPYVSPYSSTNSAFILAQIHQLETLLAQLKAQAQPVPYPSYPYSGGAVLGVSNYKFYSYVAWGSSGSDVTALQQRLMAEGVYSGPVTGYFGTLTTAAVRRYQSVRGLPLTGVLDTATRAMLNGSWY